MTITEILLLAQILSGFGGAAVDVVKVVQAMQAEGRTSAKPAEVAQINAAIAAAHPDFSVVDFLKQSAPGGGG